MKFVLAGYGSRGDVEPCVAVGRELLGRGHDVCMAVPPDKLGFVESVGLTAVASGPDTQKQVNTAADFIRHLGWLSWKSALDGHFRPPPKNHWWRTCAPSSLRNTSLEPVKSPPR